MNSKTSILGAIALSLFATASVVRAQSVTSPAPKKSPETRSSATEPGEDAGDYTIISTLEFGYRGIRVIGDENKYKSDLNYKAGPRLFDSSLLMRAKNGKGGVFDSLLVTTTGWGADPTGQVRLSVEKPALYRFDANYRRFKYFRFVNNLANPNWIFSPTTFNVPPNPITGEHGYKTEMKFGDFDLTLLPKNETIRFNIGYSPERYSGPAYTNYHVGGNEFNPLSQLRSRANDFRLGADGKVGPIDFSFLQGFRRFREDSFINLGITPGINLNPAAATLTSFKRDEPTRGSVNFTRFSMHTLIAQKLDITGRIVYSKATSESTFTESFTGRNWNPRVTGWPPTPPAATPNILNLGQYNITGRTERPNTLGDIGVTLFATDNLRISNTFRVEDFEIDGRAVFSDFFSITRGSGATLRTDTFAISNLDANRITKYRKYQNTIEGDYEFSPRFSFHLGYRYGKRHLEELFNGYNLGSNGSVTPPARTTDELIEENHTHAFIGGFKARPARNWTIYFDAERGTADNVFTRIGNYDYTNIRAKSRYAPNSKVSFTLALITKNNSNPSDIAGVSLANFGVDVKSRIFTSSLDWNAHPRLLISTGYNYNWVNSDSVIDYSYLSSTNSALRGNALYFMRNNFFFFDTTARLFPRVTLYASYRINDDNGQGSRLSDPLGARTLISSYPMTFQTPEARLAIRLNRQIDWNLGYQYYNYKESPVVGPRPQNYHAHLPYMSLRLYFGRKE